MTPQFLALYILLNIITISTNLFDMLIYFLFCFEKHRFELWQHQTPSLSYPARYPIPHHLVAPTTPSHPQPQQGGASTSNGSNGCTPVQQASPWVGGIFFFYFYHIYFLLFNYLTMVTLQFIFLEGYKDPSHIVVRCSDRFHTIHLIHHSFHVHSLRISTQTSILNTRLIGITDNTVHNEQGKNNTESEIEIDKMEYFYCANASYMSK